MPRVRNLDLPHRYRSPAVHRRTNRPLPYAVTPYARSVALPSVLQHVLVVIIIGVGAGQFLSQVDAPLERLLGFSAFDLAPIQIAYVSIRSR
jgi:hypothetical protein